MRLHDRLMRVGDLFMYCEDVGAGEPIVFIHGSLARGDATFAAQLEAFRPTHRCICPDLRGHGRTHPADFAWTSEILADDMAGLMDALNLPRAHLVGHSMGGDVALYCALKYPHRVQSVTSIGSAGAVNDAVAGFFERFRPDRMDSVKRARLAERFAAEHGPACGGNWQRLIARTEHNCTRYPDFTDADLKAIAAPVLLLYGGRDVMVLPHEVARLAAHVPRFEAVRIEDADHFPHAGAQADCVNRLIRRHITAHP